MYYETASDLASEIIKPSHIGKLLAEVEGTFEETKADLIDILAQVAGKKKDSAVKTFQT